MTDALINSGPRSIQPRCGSEDEEEVDEDEDEEEEEAAGVFSGTQLGRHSPHKPKFPPRATIEHPSFLQSWVVGTAQRTASTETPRLAA